MATEANTGPDGEPLTSDGEYFGVNIRTEHECGEPVDDEGTLCGRTLYVNRYKPPNPPVEAEGPVRERFCRIHGLSPRTIAERNEAE